MDHIPLGVVDVEPRLGVIAEGDLGDRAWVTAGNDEREADVAFRVRDDLVFRVALRVEVTIGDGGVNKTVGRVSVAEQDRSRNLGGDAESIAQRQVEAQADARADAVELDLAIRL